MSRSTYVDNINCTIIQKLLRYLLSDQTSDADFGSSFFEEILSQQVLDTNGLQKIWQRGESRAINTRANNNTRAINFSLNAWFLV